MSALPQTTRWAHWPPRSESPYYPMFYGAMRRYGVETVATLEATQEWLDAGQADVIHLHWPDSLWRRHRKGWLQQLAGVRAVSSFLTAARAAGLRIVWTAHNLGAHEGGGWVD